LRGGSSMLAIDCMEVTDRFITELRDKATQ
jgi:hypothetical protein